MFYTGINPLDMKPVYVVTDYHEKQLQRALLQFNRPENADLVREALTRAGRTDLIGFGPECLVRPAGSRPAPRGEGKPVPKNGKPASGKTGSGHGSAKDRSSAKDKASAKGQAPAKGGVYGKMPVQAAGSAGSTAKTAPKGNRKPAGKTASKGGKGRR